jgi:uncharacterized membrane protein YfhO
MRGVYLPAGKHIVEFIYVPTWFRIGLFVTALTVVVITVLLIAASKP